MKKYLGIVILMASLLAMGSASAFTIQETLKVEANSITIGTLHGGGHGGGGGCHNNTNMTELTGILAYDGMMFSIGTTTLNFGCYNYLNNTASPYDFDGDGTIETILAELMGMVGTSITVEGISRCQSNRLVVFYINGFQYRDPEHCKYIS